MPDSKQATGAEPIGYLAFLPRIRRVAMDLGYTIAIHGSLARDFDLIACPWTETAVDAEELAHAVSDRVGGFIDKARHPVKRPHGRLAWSIHLGGGPYIDLSVMPRITEQNDV